MHRIGDSDKVTGWHIYYCQRCKEHIHSPYGLDRQAHYCRAWPLPQELGKWVALFLAACYITKKPGGCKPCQQREEALNTLGSRIRAWHLSIWARIRAFWKKD